MLPTLFAPALAQITERWTKLSAHQIEKMVKALPDATERATVLDWNARLSMQDRRFLEPCQAVYEALRTWDSLTDMEKVTVSMAGIGPISEAAARLGLIPGAVVR